LLLDHILAHSQLATTCQHSYNYVTAQ